MFTSAALSVKAKNISRFFRLKRLLLGILHRVLQLKLLREKILSLLFSKVLDGCGLLELEPLVEIIRFPRALPPPPPPTYASRNVRQKLHVSLDTSDVFKSRLSICDPNFAIYSVSYFYCQLFAARFDLLGGGWTVSNPEGSSS